MKNFNKPSTSIKNWAKDDQPREKLQANGPGILSNSELLAILINNGTPDRSALEIAKEVLNLGHNNLHELGKLNLKELQKIKGIGIAKAITLAAALELGRRRHAASIINKTIVRSAGEVASYLKAMLKDLRYEVFAVIFLNQSNTVKHFEVVSQGGITGTIADPRVILKKALEESATSLILCHNHPSGNLRPSFADEQLTQKIKEAAKYFDIKVIDHIIVSEDGYYSFADDGIL